MVAAAFFDVDRTILQGSSLLALVGPLRTEKLLPMPVVMRAAIQQLWFTVRGLNSDHLDSGAAAAAAAVRGINAAELQRVGAAAIPRVVVPRIYEEARREIAAHKAAGRKVFLVSSAPIEVVAELGRILGADDVAATVSEIDANGVYTGRITTFCHGANKAVALGALAAKHGVDLAESTAYGDSMSDVAMLSAVGTAIAVNPDKRLRREAGVRGWEIRSFHTRPGPRLGDVGVRPIAPRPRGPRDAGATRGRDTPTIS